MAKSEHQGLQIGLILFAMISVVLAITTFLYYRQSEEAAKAAEDAKKKMEAATTRANDFQARVDYVLHILGQTTLPDAEVDQLKQSFGGDEKMKTVVQNFEKFIDTFGAGMPKEKLNYAAVAPAVLTAVRGSNTSLLQQTAESSKLAKDNEETRAKEAERTQLAVKSQQEAEKKLDAELTKYDADRKALEDKQQTQLASFSQEIAKKKSEIDEVQNTAGKLTKEVGKLEVVVKDQANTIVKMRDEPFEVPDGQITWVNQSANTVWINLGLADGLRRQTMFSVFDQADNGVTRAEKKASVEVTRVLDQHLCEARIISDSAANPILPGDQVFSPAWRPGKRVRFALAGLLDLDGDGVSDRARVRNLLVASGGAIDQEMHDDGEIVGKMSSSTRYLVLGIRPDERSDAKVLTAYSQMQKEAEQFGVEIISIDKLMDWVGYRPEDRTVGLGKNANPAQFKPKPPEGKAPTSQGIVSEKFRERRPTDKTKAGEKSAFDK